METNGKKQAVKMIAAAATACGIVVGMTLWIDEKFQDHEIHLTESEARIIQYLDEKHLELFGLLDDSEELLIDRMLTIHLLTVSGDLRERAQLLEALLEEQAQQSPE